MHNQGYNLAFEQATEERAEIRVKIEQLLARGEMLDKLLECLAPFISVPQPPAESSPASHEGAAPAHSEEHYEHHQG